MTPIIIPAYEPDERLIELLASMLPAEESANEPAGTETASLQDAAHPGTAPGPVVIVDDGSGDACREIFEKAALYVNKLGGAILTHEVNKGKGRALKTAFAYVLKTWPDAIGCVTADSDGQHTAACIASVQKALEANPDKLVLHITGDGSFRMNLNELSTEQYYGLPIITVVFNNGTLGMVRQWQTLTCGGRHSQTTLDRGPDFVKLAEAYGLAGRRVTDVTQLEAALHEAIDEGRGMVIDCAIATDEMVRPMVSGGGHITEFMVD